MTWGPSRKGLPQHSSNWLKKLIPLSPTHKWLSLPCNHKNTFTFPPFSRTVTQNLMSTWPTTPPWTWTAFMTRSTSTRQPSHLCQASEGRQPQPLNSEVLIWAAILEAGNANERILCSRGNSGSSFPVAVLMRDSFIIALDGFCDRTWRNVPSSRYSPYWLTFIFYSNDGLSFLFAYLSCSWRPTFEKEK